jgi:hypothetical protein
MRTCGAILGALVLLFCGVSRASTEALQMGADRLVSLQNDDGCWDWSFDDGSGSAGVDSEAINILAPTAMGLLGAYRSARDAAYLPSLVNAGQRLLSKAPVEITPDDGYFAVALDAVFDVNTYTDYVKANFYDPLAAGTYDFLGDGSLQVNAQGYVFLLGLWRDYQDLPNLAALDCGVGLYSAGLIGADTSAWIEGVKAEIEELDGADVFDVLGLAGAVLGLASVGEDFDPNVGECAEADGLADLAAILASYQLSTGGFTWNSRNLAEGQANETVQETAFAILALAQCDPEGYRDVIARAAAYLEAVQLPTGGWEDYLGQGENCEVTGESLWALRVAQQTLAEAEAVEEAEAGD